MDVHEIFLDKYVDYIINFACPLKVNSSLGAEGENLRKSIQQLHSYWHESPCVYMKVY